MVSLKKMTTVFLFLAIYVSVINNNRWVKNVLHLIIPEKVHHNCYLSKNKKRFCKGNVRMRVCFIQNLTFLSTYFFKNGFSIFIQTVFIELYS